MNDGGLLFQTFVLLAAAVVAVPIASRLGLGSVLGYLLAGVTIGPFGLELIGNNTQDLLHFAEFGVVMMSFVIGLELQPPLLWRLRDTLVGMGGLQVLGTTAVAFGIGLAVDQPWRAAVAIGLILSLSSTAIVLQSLAERGHMKSDAGQRSFAVLLFRRHDERHLRELSRARLEWGTYVDRVRANIRALEDDLQREFAPGATPLRDTAWDNTALREEAARRAE